MFHCQKLRSNIYLVISRRPRPNGQPVAGPDTFRERFSEPLLPKGLCCPMAKARPRDRSLLPLLAFSLSLCSFAPRSLPPPAPPPPSVSALASPLRDRSLLPLLFSLQHCSEIAPSSRSSPSLCERACVFAPSSAPSLFLSDSVSLSLSLSHTHTRFVAILFRRLCKTLEGRAGRERRERLVGVASGLR